MACNLSNIQHGMAITIHANYGNSVALITQQGVASLNRRHVATFSVVIWRNNV